MLPHLGNLGMLSAEAIATIAEHDADHGIVRSPQERADLELLVRDVFTDGYFQAHFPRLTGLNGMAVTLPWLRRSLPSASRPTRFGAKDTVRGVLDQTAHGLDGVADQQIGRYGYGV